LTLVLVSFLRVLDKADLGQGLWHPVVTTRIGRSHSRHSAISQLIQRYSLGLDESNVSHVDNGNVGTLAWVLNRVTLDNGISRVRLYGARFDRANGYVISRLAVSKSDQELKKRIAQLNSFAHDWLPSLRKARIQGLARGLLTALPRIGGGRRLTFRKRACEIIGNLLDRAGQ
jgi:hypothetical protein